MWLWEGQAQIANALGFLQLILPVNTQPLATGLKGWKAPLREVDPSKGATAATDPWWTETPNWLS